MIEITDYTCWDFTTDEPTYIKFERNEVTGKIRVLSREPKPCPFVDFTEGAKQLIFKHSTRTEEITYATLN